MHRRADRRQLRRSRCSTSRRRRARARPRSRAGDWGISPRRGESEELAALGLEQLFELLEVLPSAPLDRPPQQPAAELEEAAGALRLAHDPQPGPALSCGLEEMPDGEMHGS